MSSIFCLHGEATACSGWNLRCTCRRASFPSYTLTPTLLAIMRVWRECIVWVCMWICVCPSLFVTVCGVCLSECAYTVCMYMCMCLSDHVYFVSVYVSEASMYVLCVHVSVSVYLSSYTCVGGVYLCVCVCLSTSVFVYMWRIV